MPTSVVKVLKFGGTSVGSSEALSRLACIVEGEYRSSKLVVVVSALSGITELLESLLEEAQPAKKNAIVRAIVMRHIKLSRDVLEYRGFRSYLGILSRHIETLLNASRQPESPERSHAILATGELMSAPLVAALLRQRKLNAQSVDARSFVCLVMSGSGEWVVDRIQTRQKTQAWHSSLEGHALPVVTGFVGSSASGQTITLGRGGSDFSASLIAEAIGAAKFDRWTDVDGLFTADPNRVGHASKFLYLLLEDAATWNETGQLGMHSKAFEPVLQACIPLHVRSTKYPQGDGTLIIPTQLPDRVQRDAREKIEDAERRGALSIDAEDSREQTTS